MFTSDWLYLIWNSFPLVLVHLHRPHSSKSIFNACDVFLFFLAQSEKLQVWKPFFDSHNPLPKDQIWKHFLLSPNKNKMFSLSCSWTDSTLYLYPWVKMAELYRKTKAQKTRNLGSTLTLLTFSCIRHIFCPMVKNLTAEHKGNIYFYLWFQSVELWKLNSSHKLMFEQSNLLGIFEKVAVPLRGGALLEEVCHKKDIS